MGEIGLLMKLSNDVERVWNWSNQNWWKYPFFLQCPTCDYQHMPNSAYTWQSTMQYLTLRIS